MGRTIASLDDSARHASVDEGATLSEDEFVLGECAYACAARFFLAASVRDRVRVWPKLPPEMREQDRREFQQAGPQCGFDDVVEFLDELLATANPESVPNPEAARPLSDDECARAVAFHAMLNPNLPGDVLRDWERDLRARPGEEPPAEQLEERAATLEAYAQQPGEQWALPYVGTRALIAETLAAQAANVQKAVVLLCEAAGKGDLAAAKALVPYFDQALGKPTERVEFKPPTTLEELEALSDEDLQRLVAQGRADRLRREQEARALSGDDDDDQRDWRTRSVE